MQKEKPPLRPGQVTLEELQSVTMPLKVNYHHGTCKPMLYTIIGLDIPNRRAKVNRQGNIYLSDYIYLSDCCVTPYENGNWNLNNWLEFAEEVVLADEPVMVTVTKLPRT